MPTEISMPKMGMSMTEGRIARWLKQPGEAVTAGEELVEIETEKIVSLIEAPVSGTLAAVLVPEGESALVQAILAIITAPGESLDVPAPPAEPALQRPEWLSASPTTAGSPASTAPPQAATGSATLTNGAAGTPPTAAPALAAPAARRVARELGVDLVGITGTGPRGMIVEADVRKAAQARSASPATPAPAAAPAASSSPVRRVSFYSDGQRLAGVLYSPLGHAGPRPAAVVLAGYTYLKEMVVSEMARSLAREGFVALVFDYRGFGESEGAKQRLMPMEQVADTHAAITFLLQQPGVDPAAVVAIGLSLGGSHAVSAAATDGRIAAAVAIESPADGERWLRSLRRHSEWLDFRKQVADDRAARTLTGTSTAVDSLQIVLPDPDSARFLEQVSAEFPQMRTQLTLASADALIGYAPESLAAGLRDRPLLIIHGDDDRLVPVAEAFSLYEAAPNARLEVIAGMGHFDWVFPTHPTFKRVMDTISSWCKEQLAP